MKIKTSENIFESIVQEKYYYNIHAQTLGEYAEKLDEKWVAVESLENIKLVLKDTLTDYDLWIGQSKIQNGSSAWEVRQKEIKDFLEQLEEEE